ncbi:MAG TPA: B-box zinc finger protein [Terriglobia bacterium]|nr:B-box zinc finger protein [Terriglobia bacterium]
MKNPWWLRLMGPVAGLSAVMFGVSITVWNGFFMQPRMLPVLVAWAALTVGLFLAWVLITGMIWAANRSARTQAAITFEVLADSFKNMGSAAAPESPSRGVWDNPPTDIICDDCKRPHAMLYCRKHKATLCFLCTGKHDAEDCLYVAADRHAHGPQKETTATKRIGSLLGI